jgi:hypothetical protein
MASIHISINERDDEISRQNSYCIYLILKNTKIKSYKELKYSTQKYWKFDVKKTQF